MSTNYTHETDRREHRRTSRTIGMAAVLFASLTGLSLSACNTVEGAGQDIQAAGESIEDAAN